MVRGDVARADTMAEAMRRALFNSISLEEERIRAILPIAAKYGAMLVLLPLTDQGIPATVTNSLYE